MRARSPPARRSSTIWARIHWTPSSWSWLLKKASTSRFPMRTRKKSAPCRTPSITSESIRKVASSLGRRVVVTGIGLICGVGNTTGEVWQGVLAGKRGVARIHQFDATNFACQIAAEVKNFDPLNFIEKKEVKKMGGFIHLALAAAEEAFKMSGLKITAEYE